MAQILLDGQRVVNGVGESLETACASREQGRTTWRDASVSRSRCSLPSLMDAVDSLHQLRDHPSKYRLTWGGQARVISACEAEHLKATAMRVLEMAASRVSTRLSGTQRAFEALRALGREGHEAGGPRDRLGSPAGTTRPARALRAMRGALARGNFVRAAQHLLKAEMTGRAAEQRWLTHSGAGATPTSGAEVTEPTSTAALVMAGVLAMMGLDARP